MALLAPEALRLEDGDAGDAHFVKGLLHLVELERLDDRVDLLHPNPFRLLRCTICANRAARQARMQHGPSFQRKLDSHLFFNAGRKGSGIPAFAGMTADTSQR